ncbi:S-adenosyl-L-methionine-dependent methyltransferase [Hypoxylon sp. FL1150]|nr:S-adenosyl-L-methionine-dependent methyltransferase [Hypoxylon sp. FL1150]
MARLRLANWLHASPTPTSTGSDCRKTNHKPAPEPLQTTAPEKKHPPPQRFQIPEADTPSIALPMSTMMNAPQAVTGMSSSKIVALAQKISDETQKVDAYFHQQGLQTPGFDPDAPGDFPKMPEEISTSRREIIHATRELHDLMIGPKESVRWMAWDFLNTQSLQLINHYGIANMVPLDGTITIEELEAKTPLDSTTITRLLRHAMANHLFQEPTPGVVAHTAASKRLAMDDALQAWVGFNSEEVYPGSARVIDALKEHPEATSLTHAGFNVAYDTVGKEPMFVTLGKDPQRAQRMALAMSSLTGGEGYELSYLTEGCDLSEVDARGGTLVDLGGSHGFACVAFGGKYRNMNFVVQDLPATVASAPSPVCADVQVAKRITFQAHDFFTEQSVKNADAFLFRWIIHNYSRPYAVQLLRNLIPALKPGARIIINDYCISPPGVEKPWDERLMRSMDMVMLTLLNAQEREERDFIQLFEQADDGFVFKGITRPQGCRMSIIEAVWKPDEVDQNTSQPDLAQEQRACECEKTKSDLPQERSESKHDGSQ